jgi:hypothetical protein
MRNSTEERFGRLRQSFWDLCEKHLDRPPMLSSDYVLARVYKHCLIFTDLESLVGNKEIENEFYHFKEMFNTRAKKEETRKEFFDITKQIYTL